MTRRAIVGFVMSKTALPPIRPAATVIVLRDGPLGPETFMVRRHEGTAFMAGAYVFPGGRVDPADGARVDPSWCDGIDVPTGTLDRTAALAHRIAAVRELFEEAGVLLAHDADGRLVSLADPAVHARFTQYRHDIHGGTHTLRELALTEGFRVALGTLVPFARWITPPVDTRRFDAWFFVACMPPNQVPAHDEAETTHSAWLRPSDALDAARRDEILLPPPTWATLRELEPFTRAQDAIDWARTRRIEPREPKFFEAGGRRMLLLPGDPLNETGWHEPPLLETRFVQDGARWRAERAGSL